MMTTSVTTTHKPAWLRRPVPPGGRRMEIEQAVHTKGLHSVCREARCPNRGECYSRGTVTFLVLGDCCTRDCRFCSVSSGTPLPPDPAEPKRLAEAIHTLGIRHVVVTSVTRDDLPDGGADHFARIIHAVRKRTPSVTVEVLVPDFGGDILALDRVLEARPDVLNHNVETIERLYPAVRPQADYHRSLAVLAHAAQRGNTLVKSGIMVGLGERPEEIDTLFGDCARAGCRVLTVGQYLSPDRSRLPVTEYITPEQFAAYRRRGREAGLAQVVAGPYVRSSYLAEEVFLENRTRSIHSYPDR